MSYENWGIDAACHFGAGIAVSGGSNLLYRKANPRDERVSRKRDCLSSIEVILDSQPIKNVTPEGAAAVAPGNGVPTDSFQYAQNVMAVRDYLAQNGKISLGDGAVRRFASGVKAIFTGDKINNMSLVGTSVFTLGMEAMDNITGVQFYSTQVGESPIGAVWRNIYQVPSFLAGLYTGRAVTRTLQWASRSTEERQMDRTIDELLKQTSIVDIIMTYEPSENVQRQFEREGLKVITGTLNRAGRKLLSGAKTAVTAIGAGQERRKAALEAERAKTRSRFDDIVKGR